MRTIKRARSQPHIKYESPGGNVRVYFPIVTSIVLSVVLTLILRLFGRFFGR
jgi:DUF2905 family protein